MSFNYTQMNVNESLIIPVADINNDVIITLLIMITVIQVFQTGILFYIILRQKFNQ